MADLFPTFRRLTPRGWLITILAILGLCLAFHFAAPKAGYQLIRSSYYQDNLQRFADEGDAGAQFQMSVRYSTANPPDYASARFWYEKAAAQNHDEALKNLGTMYQLGQGVPVDRNRASLYYRQSEQSD